MGNVATVTVIHMTKFGIFAFFVMLGGCGSPDIEAQYLRQTIHLHLKSNEGCIYQGAISNSEKGEIIFNFTKKEGVKRCFRKVAFFNGEENEFFETDGDIGNLSNGKYIGWVDIGAQWERNFSFTVPQ